MYTFGYKSFFSALRLPLPDVLSSSSRLPAYSSLLHPPRVTFIPPSPTSPTNVPGDVPKSPRQSLQGGALSSSPEERSSSSHAHSYLSRRPSDSRQQLASATNEANVDFVRQVNEAGKVQELIDLKRFLKMIPDPTSRHQSRRRRKRQSRPGKKISTSPSKFKQAMSLTSTWTKWDRLPFPPISRHPATEVLRGISQY